MPLFYRNTPTFQPSPSDPDYQPNAYEPPKQYRRKELGVWTPPRIAWAKANGVWRCSIAANQHGIVFGGLTNASTCRPPGSVPQYPPHYAIGASMTIPNAAALAWQYEWFLDGSSYSLTGEISLGIGVTLAGATFNAVPDDRDAHVVGFRFKGKALDDTWSAFSPTYTITVNWLACGRPA